jgi:hypothetical protein
MNNILLFRKWGDLQPMLQSTYDPELRFIRHRPDAPTIRLSEYSLQNRMESIQAIELKAISTPLNDSRPISQVCLANALPATFLHSSLFFPLSFPYFPHQIRPRVYTFVNNSVTESSLAYAELSQAIRSSHLTAWHQTQI